MQASFGKYQLIASLGEGGMAEVYLAVARGPAGFNKLVVIKSPRKEVKGNANFRAMLLDEARLAARLQHPNVVQTLEVGDVDGDPFIAMEYLDGQPLNRVIATARKNGQRLGAPFSARVVAEVLAGLNYAHELKDYSGEPLGIIHRDVSPHNIFITYEGEVKVVDFGIARASTNVSQTEAGQLKGKVSYMAPEQASGAVIDSRADLFAAGLVLWEMLAGKRLLDGDAAALILHKLFYEPLPPVSDVVADVDPSLDLIVRRALEKKPEDRFQTGTQMREALLVYLESATSRELRREDMGKRVRSMFAEEREEVEKQIKSMMEWVAFGDSATIKLSSSQPPPALPHIGKQFVSGSSPDPVKSGVAPPSAPTRVSGRRSTDPPAAATVPPQAPRALWRIGAAGAVVAMVALAAFGVGRMRSAAPKGNPSNGADAAAPQVARAETVLRLQGSTTVGGELAPYLIEAFMKGKGAQAVERRAGDKPEEMQLVASMAGGGQQAVALKMSGSSTAFDALANDLCDVGMSSRTITQEQADMLKLKGFGDMRGPANEHVIALDGIAIIVHPNRALRSLDTTQLASAFSGDVTTWDQLGQPPGPITIYARAESGTLDLFKQLVLRERDLVVSAKRFDDSAALSSAVAGDMNGLGFIGWKFIRVAKAIAIADSGSSATVPSPFTVTTEEYPLSRRLYLYTPGKPKPLALEFVGFALSPEGQKVVREAGFVDLNIGFADPGPCTPRCPPRYAALTKRARRLSVDFRFRGMTSDLDSRAMRDIGRLIPFLQGHPGARLMLLAFSDPAEDAAASLKRSREYAEAVAAELSAHGVHATVAEGFGAEMALASNRDVLGRERNRRVEVWMEGEGP